MLNPFSKKYARILIEYVMLIAAFLLVFGLCGCNSQLDPPPQDSDIITVTILNGEHYNVIGENKREINVGDDVSFDIQVERGYKIIGAYGDECEVSENLSFEQTVKFIDVQYKSTLRLQTQEMDVSGFNVLSKDSDTCSISIESVLGNADKKAYYSDDILNIAVTPNDGYAFQCWSTGGFLSDGGSFYSYDFLLTNFDFNNIGELYVNIKDISDTGNEIFYIMENGVELEQDCTNMLEHHYRANTFIAEDLREAGIDCYSRMLIGWKGVDGKYVGLGSKVAVSDKEATILYPVWKDYTASSNFEVEAGATGATIKRYSGSSENGEVVIPREIGGLKVTAIGAGAFEDSAAHTYYLPDTILTVEDYAFRNCESLVEFYMCDNIAYIDDKSFAGCKNFTTLHINAAIRPKYIGYKEAVKANIFDFLAYNVESDKKNLVILGGSSVSHGYSREVIQSEFEQAGYEAPNVYNLGWNASLCSLTQFEMILPYLRQGDILIHAPEHYVGSWGGDVATSLLTGGQAISLEGMVYECVIAESDWDLISGLTINKYARLFTGFKEYNDVRLTLPAGSYADMWYNQNEYGFNVYGEEINPECGENKKFWNDGCEINPAFDDIINRTAKNIYKPAIDKGVKVYVTYPPVCKQDILTKYDTDEKIATAADAYSAKLHKLLDGINGLDVILTQRETIYDSSHFSNHPYHLGSPFRNEHTFKVITALIDSIKNDEVK